MICVHSSLSFAVSILYTVLTRKQEGISDISSKEEKCNFEGIVKCEAKQFQRSVCE